MKHGHIGLNSFFMANINNSRFTPLKEETLSNLALQIGHCSLTRDHRSIHLTQKLLVQPLIVAIPPKLPVLSRHMQHSKLFFIAFIYVVMIPESSVGFASVFWAVVMLLMLMKNIRATEHSRTMLSMPRHETDCCRNDGNRCLDILVWLKYHFLKSYLIHTRTFHLIDSMQKCYTHYSIYSKKTHDWLIWIWKKRHMEMNRYIEMKSDTRGIKTSPSKSIEDAKRLNLINFLSSTSNKTWHIPQHLCIGLKWLHDISLKFNRILINRTNLLVHVSYL